MDDQAVTEINKTEVVIKKEKRHISKLALMYVIGTFLIIGAQLGGGWLLMYLFPQLSINADFQFLAVMMPLYLIGMPLTWLLVRFVPASEIKKHSMKISHLIISFMMCFAIMYLSNIIGNIVTAVIGAIKGNSVANTLGTALEGVSTWAIFLITVIFAPVWEEILFRKLIAERLVRYGEGVAIVVSALLFGLFHGNLNQFAYAFTLGLFFAFIYVKTGKLIYVILLHMGINLFGSVISVWILNAVDIQNLQAELMSAASGREAALEGILPKVLILLGYLAVLILIVIAGVVLLILKRKKFVLAQGDILIPKGKKFSTVILNLGMLLYIILWLGMMVNQLLI